MGKNTYPQLNRFTLCYLSKRCKIICLPKSCTQMFIAALFILARFVNRACPSTDEWINKYGKPKQGNMT